MKKQKFFKQGIVLGIFLVLVEASVVTSIQITENEDQEQNRNIELVGSCSLTWTHGKSHFIRGNYAYVTSWGVTNISDDDCGDHGCPPPEGLQDYIGCIDIIDISDPVNPYIVATIQEAYPPVNNLRQPWDIYVQEDNNGNVYAYIADFAAKYGGPTSQIFQVDVTTPENPLGVVFQIDSNLGNAQAVFCQNND